MIRLSTTKREQRIFWECGECGGYFLCTAGVTPNFCPYCRGETLRIVPTPESLT